MARNFAQPILRDKSGNVTTMFAFAIIPVALFIGLGVDYGKSLWLKSKTQLAADEAALSIVAQANAYMSANNAYPPSSYVGNTIIPSAVNQIAAQTGAATTSLPTPIYCAPTTSTCSGTYNGHSVTLSPGQALVNVPATQPRLFWDAASATGVNVAASSIASSSFAPRAKVNYNFQYAKGDWFKIVKLWATPSGQSAPIALATWTYQPTNESASANPANPPPTFTYYASETGIGTTTVAYNAYLTSNNLIDSNNTIDLSGFTSPYLTMWVEYGPCAPGTTQQNGNWQPDQTHINWYMNHYSGYNGNNAPNTTLQCIGTPSNDPSQYSLVESTNAAQNSNYIYINGAEQAANTVLPLATLFPCPTDNSSTTQTIEHSWEDWSNAPATNRDFFFSVTVTCGSNATSSNTTRASLQR